MKNVASKTRPATNPYITWTDPRTGWTYKLLKSWQADNSKPFGRWLMDVEGWGHDVGDTWVAELRQGLSIALAQDKAEWDKKLWPTLTDVVVWALGGKPTR